MKKRAFALITALCMTLTCFASAETVKHERVYAVTNAAGDALTIIDNVRLENGDALTEIDDRTLLTALENVGRHGKIHPERRNRDVESRRKQH